MAARRDKIQVTAMGKAFLGVYFWTMMLESNNGLVTAMEKAILGDYIWKLMLRIKRNRRIKQPNKALPRVLAERTAFN